ncbi:MAG: hypothetical protein AB7T10_09795 [bacterium]
MRIPKSFNTAAIFIIAAVLLISDCSFNSGPTSMSQELHKVSGTLDGREVEWTF